MAREFSEALRSKGLNPWLDVEQLSPGDVWKRTIFDAIENSAAALVLVSEDMKSKNKFVSEELRWALSLMKERRDGSSGIIPIRIAGAEMPRELQHIQWLDLGDPSEPEGREVAVERVLKTLERVLN